MSNYVLTNYEIKYFQCTVGASWCSRFTLSVPRWEAENAQTDAGCGWPKVPPPLASGARHGQIGIKVAPSLRTMLFEADSAAAVHQ